MQTSPLAAAQPDAQAAPLPTVPGTPFGGGVFVGYLAAAGVNYALVLADKEAGQTVDAWLPTRTDVPGAGSDLDGPANTVAMAEAGSAIAQWARGLRIAGHDDWYIPARRELALCWAACPELFEAEWHWSSTQYSRNYAWIQGFGDGDQFNDVKGYLIHARAVRRFVIR